MYYIWLTNFGYAHNKIPSTPHEGMEEMRKIGFECTLHYAKKGEPDALVAYYHPISGMKEY